MFGDMSSMASMLAAAAMAASSNSVTATAKLNPNQQNFLNYNPMIASLQQDLVNASGNTNSSNSSQAAALAAVAFKYNAFYNSIDILNAQKHQSYSTSLAKLMSYCYNKPADHMQRLLTEQTQNSMSNTSVSFSSNHQPLVAPMPLQFQASLHQQQQNTKSNMRYHPYMKSSSNDLNTSILKLHQQHQMTINTNNKISSPTYVSPALPLESNPPQHKKHGSISPCNQNGHISRTPSPIESIASNQSIQNENISRPSSSISSSSLDSNDVIKTNE